jgi:phospholipid/cholesterol/gamma-HCH transport system substrate-binding protein
MNHKEIRFRVGLFVLGSLILLAALITAFSGFPSIFTQHNRYTIVFPEAPGVAAGTPVRRSGVRIGEVSSVKLDDETGQVRVEISVERQHTLRRGDQAVLVHGLLGGDTTIDFVPVRANGQPQPAPPAADGEKAKAVPPPQEPDQTPIPPGSELQGSARTDLNRLLNQFADILPPAQDALNELRRMAPEMRRTNDEIFVAARNWGRLGERADILLQTNEEKLVKTLDSLNDTVNRISNVFNDENQRNLSVTIKNVRAGTENLGNISKNTDELVRESRQTLHRVNESVTRTDEVLGNLQQATKPMAERSASVMKNLDESTDKLNHTLTEVRELLRSMQGSDGTLRRLSSDPALYNNLNDAAVMAARLMPRLDRALRDLEVFADKLARHPELIGLGGAVNPSRGLKESPAAPYPYQHPPGR